MTHTSEFTPQERFLRDLLRVLDFVFSLLAVYTLTQYAEAGAGLGLLAFMFFFASADVRRFRAMIWVICGGLAFTAAAALLIALRTSAPGGILLGIDAMGCTLAGLLVLYALQRTAPSEDTVLPWKTSKPTTRAEQIIGVVCVGLAGVIAVGMALSSSLLELPGLAGKSIELIAPSALFFVLIAINALMAAFDLRRNGEYLTLIIIGAFLAIVGHLLTASSTWLLAAEAVVLVAFWALRAWLNRTLLDYLTFFHPGQFWALAAISDGLIEGGPRELLRPHEVALSVDVHLASFPAPKLVLSRVAIAALDLLLPFLFDLRPPLSYMHLNDRTDFLDRQFKIDIIHGRGVYAFLKALNLKEVINLVEGLMRFVMQFAYLGYYSAPKVQEAIGYVPFSKRVDERLINARPIQRYPPLQVITPDDADRLGIDVIDDADVVIIGSGAAGSILAEQLIEKHDRRVLMIEKGQYLNPDDFTESEIDMIGKLYGDNALQVTSSMRFSILQGSAVGGTTVANNAVCFETPPHLLDRWNDQYSASIDPGAYWRAQEDVIKRLHINRVDETAATRSADQIVNPVAALLQQGITKALGPSGYKYEVVKANIVDCLGCGYCNIGCKFGRKLSMLDEVLPKVQRDHGDKLQIMSEAEAVHLRADGDTVTEVTIRIGGKRTITIRKPKTVVVSGGTIASSWLLLRSNIGRNLPVGRRLSFNMGSPLHARFPQVMNAYDGLQISHALQIEGQDNFIFETWFNPPVAQALVMPGWLDSHFRNMSRYRHFVAMGIVVGTDARDDTYVRGARLFPGSAEVVYSPSSDDIHRLVQAMMTMGGILLAAGAEEVLASTQRYHSYQAYAPGERIGRAQAVYRSEDDLMRYLSQLVQSENDILLSSAHPQGGNPLGTVLDPDFRVRGYRNLYVCDASVFPSSVTVNPQLTVMNLARYAGDRIQ